MIKITETKRIIRIETADRHFVDFDLSEYEAEQRAREWFNDMSEANKYPRKYTGTIVMELTEVD